jgi:hypothetical protein
VLLLLFFSCFYYIFNAFIIIFFLLLLLGIKCNIVNTPHIRFVLADRSYASTRYQLRQRKLAHEAYVWTWTANADSIVCWASSHKQHRSCV